MFAVKEKEVSVNYSASLGFYYVLAPRGDGCYFMKHFRTKGEAVAYADEVNKNNKKKWWWDKNEHHGSHNRTC